MSLFIQKIMELFLDKKRVIGWVSAAMIAIGAAYAGISSKDFKDAVCTAPVLESPAK